MYEVYVVVISQSLSCVQLFATPWAAACQASLPFTISWSLLKLMSIESLMPSDLLILCYPLLLLPSIFPSIKVFSSESALIRWLKYQSFRITISPSSEYSELISFRIDWFDFLAVQGTLKSFLQNSVLQWASFLWCSAFFIAQLPPHTWLLGKPGKFIDMCMYVTYISMGFHDFKKLTVFLRLSYQNHDKWHQQAHHQSSKWYCPDDVGTGSVI